MTISFTEQISTERLYGPKLHAHINEQNRQTPLPFGSFFYSSAEFICGHSLTILVGALEVLLFLFLKMMHAYSLPAGTLGVRFLKSSTSTTYFFLCFLPDYRKAMITERRNANCQWEWAPHIFTWHYLLVNVILTL